MASSWTAGSPEARITATTASDNIDIEYGPGGVPSPCESHQTLAWPLRT
jgi:hypothetical protein